MGRHAVACVAGLVLHRCGCLSGFLLLCPVHIVLAFCASLRNNYNTQNTFLSAHQSPCPYFNMLHSLGVLFFTNTQVHRIVYC